MIVINALSRGDKICKKCGLNKPVSEFSTQRANKDGLRGSCRACIREYSMTPEVRARTKASHDKPSSKARARERQHNNYLKAKASGLCFQCHQPARPGTALCEKHHAKNLESASGYILSLEEKNALLVKQNGKCAICLKSPEGATKHVQTLCVDHCHKTGKVRGLLCHMCNKAIGHLQDSADLAQRAAEYLLASN